jgi:peptidoglycan/LPS O-acetylase OafA/YrhL
LGNLGVPVFFVISGFVISHSIAEQWITRRYFWNFVLRRVIRLDPPYWFTIFFVIVTTLAGNRLFSAQSNPIPSVGNVVAPMFYVYPLLEYEPIEAVFWTLVHEVQFYLLFSNSRMGKKAGKTVDIHDRIS